VERVRPTDDLTVQRRVSRRDALPHRRVVGHEASRELADARVVHGREVPIRLRFEDRGRGGVQRRGLGEDRGARRQTRVAPLVDVGRAGHELLERRKVNVLYVKRKLREVAGAKLGRADGAIQ
jgi:hypothetical protein